MCFAPAAVTKPASLLRLAAAACTALCPQLASGCCGGLRRRMAKLRSGLLWQQQRSAEPYHGMEDRGVDRYCMCARCRQMVLDNAAVGAARDECHSKERKTRKRRAQIVVTFAAPLEKCEEI